MPWLPGGSRSRPCSVDVVLVARLALVRVWPGRGGVRIRVEWRKFAVASPPGWSRFRPVGGLRRRGSSRCWAHLALDMTRNRCPVADPVADAEQLRALRTGASRSCRPTAPGSTNRSVGVRMFEGLGRARDPALDVGVRSRTVQRLGRRRELGVERRRAGQDAGAPVSSAEAIAGEFSLERLDSRPQVGEQGGVVPRKVLIRGDGPDQRVERRRRLGDRVLDERPGDRARAPKVVSRATNIWAWSAATGATSAAGVAEPRGRSGPGRCSSRRGSAPPARAARAAAAAARAPR